MRITIRLNLMFLLLLGLPLSFLQAQSLSRAKPNWQNLDLQTDSVFGISTVKAYNTLLKGKKSVPVIVAVIDDGVDIEHPELRSLIWTNLKEKAGNKIDDDHNGYVDDLHGWNFLGSAKADYHYDNTELTRLVRTYRTEFKTKDTTRFNAAELTRYHTYRQMEIEQTGSLTKHQRGLENLSGFKASLDTLLRAMSNSDPTMVDIKSFVPGNEAETRIKNNALVLYPIYQRSYVIANYNDNLAYDPRAGEHIEGNAHVAGADPTHGTHVAGIIAAVDPNIKLMVIRAVPYGDERDEDVAKAIRYAVANGAKLINMSFAKSYSLNKKAVDDAVKFAIRKDVLLVHAAGNDNVDLEHNDSFPNPVYEGNSGSAASWIEVGASGSKDDQNLKAGLSNYGKSRVDVFAPGVNINSTLTGNGHGLMSGTSMAAPMVTGIAALIRSYYPSLTAVQVKEIILKSVIKVNHTVAVKNGGVIKQVAFSELCRSGGIVNAFQALVLAAESCR